MSERADGVGCRIDGFAKAYEAKLLAGAREEQKQAIVSREPLTVVGAGAGTGKTHTLARRFAWLLASDPTCRVEQILTLTFTLAAATEMRERIRTTLKEWRELEPEALAHLGDAIDRLDEGYISTIHSFAYRVIRESGLDLDLDPGAGIVSEPFKRDFWFDFEWNLRTMSQDRILASLSDSPDEMKEFAKGVLKDPALLPILEHFGAGTLASLAAEAQETFGSMAVTPEDFARFDSLNEEQIRRKIADACAGSWHEAADVWFGSIFPQIEADLAKGGSVMARALCVCRDKWLERLEEARRGGEKDAVSDRNACGFFASLVQEGLADLKAKNLKADIEDLLGESLAAYRRRNKPLAEVSSGLYSEDPYSPEERKTRNMLLSVAAIGWSAWDSAKRKRGVMSFSDLVEGASSALSDNASYAARFRHIMIDEFQDTDSLQDSLVASLRKSWGSADSRDGFRTLFIVGDIKQSIYRFRHARPDIFARHSDIARREADSLFVPLMRSYRMSGRMMDAVNAVFTHVWEDGVTRSPDFGVVEYDPLLPPSDQAWWNVRNGDAAPLAPLEIMVCRPGELDKSKEETEKPEKKEKIEDSRKRLARALAKKIISIQNDGIVWDKQKGRFEKADFGDIAVLVPSRTAYMPLEEAFAERGIPVVFAGGKEYFGRGEVQDVINLLRLLDDPHDEYALVCWMESPLSGAPTGEGASLSEALRREGISLTPFFERKYPKESEKLDRLRKMGLLYGASAPLLNLLEDSGWIEAYPPEVRGRVRANVRRAVDMVMEYESSMGRSLASCADYLGREMRSDKQAPEPDQVSEAGTVRVMTVHSSKGLEFPVVVLMGMEWTPAAGGSKKGKARVSGSMGVSFSKLPSGESSLTSARHKFLDSLEEWEEYERQMYVAMTRAQERLICAGIASAPETDDEAGKKKDRSWIEWLLSANEKSGLGFRVEDIAWDMDTAEYERPAAAFSRAPLPPETDLAAGADRPGLAVSRTRPHVSLSRLSASAYSLYSWCPFAYRLRYRQGLELKWEMPDGDGYGGADLGSLAHWILAKWDFKEDTLGEFLPDNSAERVIESKLRAVPPYLRHVYKSERNRDVLRSWLVRFLRSDGADNIISLAGDGRLLKEAHFRTPYSGTNLVGSIDLYWEDESGIHIRDWKITAEERSPRELYDGQLEFYALACRLLRPEADVDVGLIHLRGAEGEEPGNSIKRISDWKDLEEKVSRMSQKAVSGPFESMPSRCPRCPFRAVCRAGS